MTIENPTTLEEAATAAGNDTTEESAPVTVTADGSTDGKEETPSLVEQLRAAIENGQVSTADVSFLDKHFQSSFNKRVDRLEKNLSNPVVEAARARGLELPEGKSVMDLMTEDNGKPFAEFMKSLVEASNEPIKQRLEKADEDESLRTGMAQAQNSYPEVKKNFPKILEIIDSSELLTKVAKKDRGEALPLIMLGVAKDIELQNTKASLARALDLMKKNGIVTKVGDSTTKAKSTAQPPKDTAKPTTLRGIAEAASEAMSEFGNAN